MLKPFSFFRSSLFLIYFGNLSILLDGVYRIYLSRNLSTEEFGLYSVLISTLAIFSILNSSFQWWCNKKYASFYYNKTFSFGFLKKNYIYLFILNIPLFILFLFGRNYLNDFYQIGNKWILILLFFGYFINILIFPIVSLVKGYHRFGVSSFMGTLYNILRVGFLFLFIFFGLTFIKAFISVVITNTIFVLIYFFVALIIFKSLFKFKNLDNKISFDHWQSDLREYSQILIFILFSTLLMNIDIILVKKKFDSESIGQYAVASMWAKLIIATTSPLIDLIFANFLKSKTLQSKNNNIFLIYMFILATIIGIVVNLFFYFFKEKIHSNQYNDIGLLVASLSLAVIPLALVQYLIFYSFNKTNIHFKNYLILFLILLITVGAILLFATNLYHVICINAISYGIIMLILIKTTLIKQR